MRNNLKTIGSWAVMGLAALLTSCNTAKDMEQQIDELYQKMHQEDRIAQ
jgi:beta-glucosidase